MSLTLTEKAAEEVKKARAAANFDDATFLRVQVVGGGCAGFDYRLQFDKNFDAQNDEKVESQGIPIVVDRQSAMYLQGTTIDYLTTFEKSGYRFINPNA